MVAYSQVHVHCLHQSETTAYQCLAENTTRVGTPQSSMQELLPAFDRVERVITVQAQGFITKTMFSRLTYLTNSLVATMNVKGDLARVKSTTHRPYTG